MGCCMQLRMIAGNWSLERIFLEYFEAEMTEIGRIPEAQMKLRILIKKTVYGPLASDMSDTVL